MVLLHRSVGIYGEDRCPTRKSDPLIANRKGRRGSEFLSKSSDEGKSVRGNTR